MNLNPTRLLAILLVGSLPVTAQKTAPAGLPLVTGSKTAVVTTESGSVRGFIHNGIYTYKGIPYAKAKRFMAPTKPDSWTGVRSSLAYGPVCPLMTPTSQVNDESEFVYHHDWGYSNEDCLRLNVWSPQVATSGSAVARKRPVMVWLHGGGYSAGSSQELPSYDGENLSRTGDVVLVSVNHRLNVLGFLDLSDYGANYKASANVGMMDLVAALQWVHANIDQFGGDPSNVTIFGQSGGGGKVSTLMYTPSAKGLIHKAIAESGTAPQFQERDMTHRVGAAVLAELGLTASQIDSIQTVPYEKLAAAGNRAVQKVRQQLAAEGKSALGLGWGPSRDGTFLPYQPTQPEALALSSDVPLLVGSTKNEFMASLSGNLRDATPEQAKAQLQKRFGDKTDAYIDAVKKTYPKDTRASDLIDIDDRFRGNTLKLANLKSAHTTAPVYVYLFTWQSPVMDGAYKAVHCMEIPFVFNNIARCEEMTGGGKEAYDLAHKMSQSWVSFARTGNPNYKELPNWQPYTEATGTTMLFDNQCVIKNHPDKEIQALATSSSPRLP
ncbi:carboxylesterase/lipase family protein [Spirosoma endbachense]|uniref:Carboxylic ester hydrolase n=1 Tax=Spirosoma endbachense TaxID=2666025 RepID=A0A6P1VUP0_9BACT|nr:carboxylesterase family protein [Spirosoma endbachense]QHV95096.1 carboxylesterase family protein [Spirosoma endbachense]